MAHIAKTHQQQPKPSTVAGDQRAPVPVGTPTDAAAAKLARAIQLAEAGQFEKALEILRKAGPDFMYRNAIGVCLMRLGRVPDAVRVFRDMVLQPGCTWIRPGLPSIYKTNYATALLLDGRPSGCLEILADVREEANPTVCRLRDAIRRWQATLPFWRRLDWRLNHVDPPHCRVPIDFPPGEFTAAIPGSNPPVHADRAA